MIKLTLSELEILRRLPLEIKIAKTKARLRDAVSRFGEDGLYLSYSGGKDSSVLLHIIKQEFNIPVVFCDTGLEYPELKELALRNADEVIRPKITFIDVLSKYGYPVLTKSQAMSIRKLTKQNLSERYRNKLLNGDERGNAGKLANKWHYLLDADFNISEQCCDKMKKAPFKDYIKKTGRVPIIGLVADESIIRQQLYLKTGCNAFENNTPTSYPLGFWTEQDILEYIHTYNVEIASVYGEVKLEDNVYRLTGVKRTGCIFCAFGSHLEKTPNRFVQLKRTHPKIHDYCIRGGKYENGKWKPHKGLGMAHVLDTIGVEYE